MGPLVGKDPQMLVERRPGSGRRSLGNVRRVASPHSRGSMNSLHPSRLSLAVLFITTLLASGALAQGVTGSAVTGTITAQDKKPLPGVVVQMRNTATGATFTAVTGSS